MRYIVKYVDLYNRYTIYTWKLRPNLILAIQNPYGGIFMYYPLQELMVDEIKIALDQYRKGMLEERALDFDDLELFGPYICHLVEKLQEPIEWINSF